MLSSILLEDEQVLTPETQFEILSTGAPKLAGARLEDAAIRERTGATVVAIERDGELLPNPGPELTVQRDDVLIVAGSDDAVNSFIKTFK